MLHVESEQKQPAVGSDHRGDRLGSLGSYAELLRSSVLLLVIAVFVRLPYFTSAVIDWDESTFILVAQSMLNGHLPHTELTALKPPLAFAPYALFILLFGQSISAVRIGGLLCVFLASVATYLGCRRYVNAAAALMAGIAVSVLSTDSTIGCTMLEHIALVPLSLVVLLWPADAPTAKRMFALGLLVALASSLKTNFALFLLVPLSLLLSALKSRELKRASSLALCLGIGFSLPFAALLLLYAATGNLDVLWHSSVVEPVAYVAHNSSATSQRLLHLFQSPLQNPAGWLLTWVLPLLAATAVLLSKSQDVKEKRFVAAMVMCLISGVFSILATGMVEVSHFYIVLAPFSAAMLAFAGRLCTTRPLRAIAPFFICCLFLLSLSPVYSQYEDAWKTAITHERADTTYKIADYLRRHQVSGKFVFFTTSHIGYWLTGAKIPTRHAHPSNMDKPFLMSAQQSSTAHELQLIFTKRPVYIVAELTESELSANGYRYSAEFRRLLVDELAANYDLETEIDGISLFRRRSQ